MYEEQGGERACWLEQVCPECGRFREDPSAGRCPGCGTPVRDEAPAVGPAAEHDRDRDRQGRARSARPRDGLGRPLPHGAPGVERQPEGVVRSPAEALVEAQRLLDGGMPFHAHEVLEDAWKAADEPERGLWRGLAQLAVGLTHDARGNPVGAVALLRRGAANIAPYRDDPPHGIDVAGLARWATGRADQLDTDPGTAPERPPRLR